MNITYNRRFVSSLLLSAAIVFVTTGCQRANSNMQVLQTRDCGSTWNLIPTGQRIPSTAATPCAYNTTLPNYPMQGDTSFKAQFIGNVLVTVKISYDYEIVDPKKFIMEAKFLGKQNNSASEASEEINNKTAQFETAENSVIDKRIREEATSRTVKSDIVEFNTASFEDELLDATNKSLAERGVSLLSMTFVMIPEEQTRTAIDAATAVNVYASKGMKELGEKIAVARAGAPKIIIGNNEEK